MPEMTGPTFWFMVGIPGSGKSFHAKWIAETTEATVICPDDIRVKHRVGSDRAFEIARQEIAGSLKAGRDVVFDATNIIRKWRRDNILAGKPHASRVVAVLMDTPLEVCLERQQKRAAQGKKATLPEDTIRQMASQLADNLPELTEGFDEIRVYRGISVTATSGKFAGRTQLFFPGQVDPSTLLTGFVQEGWHWSIEYSKATLEEQAEWLAADMMCRALLAQREGRPVHFDDREYADLRKWKATMENVGSTVSIERDDETGFWVKSVGLESIKH
ncbi:MAG: ATP-binding protein [Candidatus Moranbacteria bacterium]|nr:ATP-binding protein [Candidatus Moranbacteria bacterium]